MRIYLDLCCFNRPFDDQSQDRVALETQAISAVLGRIDQEGWELIGGTILELENSRSRLDERRERIGEILRIASVFAPDSPELRARATEMRALGLKPFGALHVASAEAAGADVLLTTDDRLMRQASRAAEKIHVRVLNPVQFVVEDVR